MFRLAELRKKKGLTQKELAKALKISESAIAMYETGRRTPSLARARIIADFFDVNIEEIFFEKQYHVMRANLERVEHQTETA